VTYDGRHWDVVGNAFDGLAEPPLRIGIGLCLYQGGIGRTGGLTPELVIAKLDLVSSR
jgi:hypothetical protein